MTGRKNLLGQDASGQSVARECSDLSWRGAWSRPLPDVARHVRWPLRVRENGSPDLIWVTRSIIVIVVGDGIAHSTATGGFPNVSCVVLYRRRVPFVAGPRACFARRCTPMVSATGFTASDCLF